MVDETLRTAFASRGLTLNEQTGHERPFAIAGETFRVKEFIKQAGGRWSREEQCWRLASAGELARLASLIAGDAGGLAESQSPFDIAPGGPPDHDAWGSKHYHGHRGRQRNKLLEKGADSLADYEILELLLFFSIWRRDTKPIAKAMIERFGGIGGTLAADPARYAEVLPQPDAAGDRGADDLHFTQALLKTVKACFERALKEQIAERPVISSWDALIDYLEMIMVHEPAEHFRILFLDRKNILIKDEVQSRGTVDHTPLYPREVVKRSLELAASAIILVHNHPSGDPTPSPPDIEMTKQVIRALQPVNISVHDHVIIGKNRHTSFRGSGLL
ncbi:MAG: DNA repair protein RadC [Geminicoccaceae bacterium]|nr:DNA repair protein RadC [Geminicoccaceae bacterium]MCB9943073.1 DNA repair protein RadC [Geminicoccaceae bacterium]